MTFFWIGKVQRHLVVILAGLVVIIASLVVILSTLVVKIATLVVIGKLWILLTSVLGRLQKQ